MCYMSANGRLPPPPRGTANNRGDKTDNAQCKNMNTSTNTHLANHKRLQESYTSDKLLNTDNTGGPEVTARPSLPHRTWSDEANGNATPPSAPGHGPEEDALGSEQMSRVPRPKPGPAASRKPIPVPVPRKPRTAVLALQEKVEEGGEIVSQEGREMNVKEVKVSPEGKGNSSPSVSVLPIFLSARKTCAQPAPPPRKRPLLSAPEKAATSAPHTPPKDVQEEDLGWDSSVQEMEVSVDKEDDEAEKEGTLGEEAVYSDFTQSPPPTSPLHHPEPQPPAVTVAAEYEVVKVAPKKPESNGSPMARMQRTGSSECELGGGEKSRGLPTQRRVLKDRVTRELPLPPVEKTSRKKKCARFSPGKPRAKSFSGADIFRSDGQKRISFRKLLDLKLAVKMLPKLLAKGGQSSDCTANDVEQSVDGDQEGCQNLLGNPGAQRKFSGPLNGVEQSVDGEDLSSGTEPDVFYENMPLYDEISDYMNVPPVGGVDASPRASTSQLADWQYNDEGIYEEQEPYMSFEKNPVQLQCQTPTECDR